MHVCVLGGGVMGVTTAYYLARDGHRVTVLERHAQVGSEASLANGAQLSYNYVAPLAAPSILPHIPAWLFRRDAPLRFIPSWNMAQWRWCAAFLRQCTPQRSEQGTIDLLQLGHYSQSLLAALLAEESIDFDFLRSGKLVVYRDARAFAGARRQMAFQAQFGSRQEALDPSACLAREPALASVAQHLVGGIWTASEDAGDCHRFCRELARVAAERFGVTFRCNVELTGLRPVNGRIDCVQTSDGEIDADAFVMALGNSGRRLVRNLGIDLPVYPLKGYSLTVPVRKEDRAPRVSVTDLHHKIVYARLGDRLRIAGMVDMTEANDKRDAYRMALLSRQARETFPQGGDYAHAQTWSGARPATPDSKPILGPSPYANLWMNTGQGSLGFTFACASARLVADALDGRPPALSLAPYGLRRRALGAKVPRTG